MPLYAWAKQVTEAAFRRGWLTRAAQARVHVLVEQHLHPEQALIGTGLVSAEQYADLIQDCWQITLRRLDIDALHAVGERQADGIEVEDEDGKRWYACADAWVSRRSVERNLPLFPTLRADLERFWRRDEALDLAVSEWIEAIEYTQETEFRLGVEEGRGVVLHGVRDHQEEVLEVGREEVPALQAWLLHGYGSRAWDGRSYIGLESHWVEAVAKHDKHPLARMKGWRQRLEQETGIVVLVEPDQWTLRQVQHVDEASNAYELFVGGGRRRVSPTSERAREEAMHAALAGASLCWIEPSEARLGDFRALAKMGIPVTVIRHRLTLHGSAWEVYHIDI